MTYAYNFQRLSLIERIKLLWPAYRRKKEREAREALRWLVEHPDAPCFVNGVPVGGYGTERNSGTYPWMSPPPACNCGDEMSEWQPIETAPKVKDEPLLLSNGEAVSQGWWMDEPGYIREHRDLEGRYMGQDESDGYTGWMDFGGGMIPGPTHWMPLPPPPATPQEPRNG